MFPGHRVHYPQSLWLLSWDFMYISAFEHSPFCVCLHSLPLRRFIWMQWGREQAPREGSRHMCTHIEAKVMGCIHFPDKPFFLVITTSHLPERVWSPSRLFIYLFFLSTPSQKKELPVLKLSLLEKVSLHWGMSWGIWAGDSMITAPETRTHALFPRGTHSYRTPQGTFPRALITALGRAWTEPVSASFLCLQFLGYKHQFQGISSQQQVEWMNKYLVTSLIMWIATELFLLCKTTKTLCRYFRYKLM